MWHITVKNSNSLVSDNLENEGFICLYTAMMFDFGLNYQTAMFSIFLKATCCIVYRLFESSQSWNPLALYLKLTSRNTNTLVLKL